MLQSLAETWWAWIVLGFALGVLEILVPGFIFLGFAIGAVLTGIPSAKGRRDPGLTVNAMVPFGQKRSRPITCRPTVRILQRRKCVRRIRIRTRCRC